MRKMMKKLALLLCMILTVNSVLVDVTIPVKAETETTSATVTFTYDDTSLALGEVQWKNGDEDWHTQTGEGTENVTHLRLKYANGGTLAGHVELRVNGNDIIKENMSALESEEGMALEAGAQYAFEHIQFNAPQGEGGPQGPGPEQPKGMLNFRCQTNTIYGGHIAYKINDETEFSHVGENREEWIYESIDLSDIESPNSLTIKFELSQGFQLDTTRGVILNVNGEKRYSKNGDDVAGFTGDNGYTFNLNDILSGDETVADSCFELEFGFESAQGGEQPGPEQPKGMLNFRCQTNTIYGGHIAYKINDETEFSHVGENREEWIYESIDLSEIESPNSLTIKFELSQGFQLDTTRGVKLWVNGEQEPRYSENGDDVAGFTGDNGYTFNLNEILSGDETVANSSFELEFGFENEQGSGGDNPELELGVINLNCQDLEEAALVMYRFGTDESKYFIPVENNTIAIPAEETSVTIQFKINEPEVYKLDTGRGISLNVNGEEKYHLSGESAEEVFVYTFDLAELAGDKAINESSFELSYGFEYIDPSMDTRPRNMLWVYSEQYGQEHHFVDPQGDVDCLVLNGDVDILSIEYKDTTYSKALLLELGAKEGEERGDIWYEVDPGNMGYAEIPAGAIVTVKLLPDYGYQVLRAELNGSEIAPTEEQSVFTFTMPTNNLHLSAVFTECKDEVVSSAGDIKSGAIQLGENEIDTGSALLTVEDADADSESAFSEKMEELDGYAITSCLDIGLQQIFYKGTKDDYWANDKDTLENEASISLSLNEEIATEDVKILHEKHDGEVEILNAIVDKEAGTVTFKTDSFSAYAIVQVCGHPANKVISENKTFATCETEGEIIKKCTKCGEIIESGIVVPALGHNYVDGVCARTGCGVVSFSLSKDIAFSVEDVKHDENAHTPVVTVTYKGEELTKGVDYIVSADSESAAGTYDVTVTGIGNYRDEITAKWSIYNETGLWCAEIPDQTYTGKAIKPTPEVFCDGIKLIAGKDYTLSYGKYNTNVALKDLTNAKGQLIAPSVTITGKGNYVDKKVITFNIVPCLIDTDTAVVDNILVAKAKSAIKINPVVELDGKKLRLGTDYVVSKTTSVDDAVTSYTDANVYNLYVVGKNNYSGAVPFTFTITEKVMASKVTVAKITDQKYDGGNQVKPVPTITYKIGGKSTDVSSHFNITYDNNTEIGIATVTITAKDGSELFIGSKKVSFKIVGTSIAGAKLGADGKEKIPSAIYNGNAYEPELNLYVGANKLTNNIDYTVTYTKNVNVGTATATITGKGNYTGTKKFTFKINKFDAQTDAEKITISCPASVAYEKGGVTPKPVVKMGDVVLVEKVDYTLSYANNKAVAKADAVNSKNKSVAPTITVSFKGNYSGKKSVSFEIAVKDIKNGEITIADKGYSTKANAWKQTAVTIVDTNGKKLVAGTDYNKTFRYYSNDEYTNEITDSTLAAKTEVYVEVTGINNYAGSIIKGSYRISERSIAKVSASIDPQTFTGTEIRPKAEDIKVWVGTGKNKTELIAGEDYEVIPGSYKNNINKGTATVTIVGKGDYYGTKVIKFTIGTKKFL